MADFDPIHDTQILQPEWFASAIKAGEKTLNMLSTGLAPESLRGWFAVTLALRLVRAVFGVRNNIEAAERLKQYVIQSQSFWENEAEIERKLRVH